MSDDERADGPERNTDWDLNGNARWVNRFKCNVCGLDWAEFWEEIRDGEWAHWCRTVMEEHNNSGFHLIKAGKRAKGWKGHATDATVPSGEVEVDHSLADSIPGIPEYPFRAGDLRIGVGPWDSKPEPSAQFKTTGDLSGPQAQAKAWLDTKSGDLNYRFADGSQRSVVRAGELMAEAMQRKAEKAQRKMIARLTETEQQRLLRLWHKAVKREKRAHNAYIAFINRET